MGGELQCSVSCTMTLNKMKPVTWRTLKCPKKSKCHILAICTPLMTRAHHQIAQSAEVLFCDSTSCLDHFNTSLFLLSTHHSFQLAALQEQYHSEMFALLMKKKKRGLEMLLQILPAKAFYNNGPQKGLAIEYD